MREPIVLDANCGQRPQELQNETVIRSRPQNRPRAPAPEPLDKPPGPLRSLLLLRTDPIAGLLRDHFELPFLTWKTVLGKVVFVNDPNAIRHVLIDNAANYCRDRIQRKMLTVPYRDSVIVAEGDQWRRQRRRIGRAFTPKMVAGFTSPVAAAASALVERWAALGAGARIDLVHEMPRALITVLEKTLFLDGFGRDLEEMIRKVRIQFDLTARVSLLDLLNMPAWIPRISDLRLRPVLSFFAQMAADVIATRERVLESCPAAPPNDLLTMLLEPDESQTGGTLSRKEAAGNIFLFLAAGHDTSAAALCWAFYLLALDPEWRDLLEAEADRELPDGHFVEGSLERLVMTRAVLEETLRLYPSVATINRQAMAADRLGEHSIEPGSFVIIAPWVVHRHRRLWEIPDLFDPSRFLPGARERIDRFAYLPFGAGPRTCIGASFAFQTLTITLATIVRTFRLELVPNSQVMPVHRVTLRPKREVPMILHRRHAK